MTTNILIIEDDQRMATMLAEYLSLEGYQTTCIHLFQDYYRSLLKDHQLILMDLMLGQDSGFELLKSIRQYSNIPIIVVSAKKDDSDKLLGFRLGADDYLTKPYNHLELVARIQAVLKRSQPDTHQTQQVNNIEINIESQQVLVSKVDSGVTSLEYRILNMLMQQVGKVVRREEIYKLALEQSHEFSSRALDVHISNLRRKLGPLEGLEQIKTVRGQGYMLVKIL